MPKLINEIMKSFLFSIVFLFYLSCRNSKQVVVHTKNSSMSYTFNVIIDIIGETWDSPSKTAN